MALIEISALWRNLVATMRSTKCTGLLYNSQLVKELAGKLSGGGGRALVSMGRARAKNRHRPAPGHLLGQA